jgi:uncharacterized protein (DUF2235 family)
MALYAFDGTWDDKNNDTNVLKFFTAYNTNQPSPLNRYLTGVGADVSLLGHLAGGLFGAGEREKVDEAFGDLQQAFAADPVIDIVGFSRGAATALDFANRVYKATLTNAAGQTVQPAIRFLGLWDTVAAFGVASLGFYFSQLNFGHHLTLPTDRIQFCFHAMALDERRPSFIVTRVRGGYQVWFRGAHSDIGGGNGNTALSNIALRWMYDKAAAAGLPIRRSDIDALQVDPQAPIDPDILSRTSLWKRSVQSTDLVHYTVTPRADHNNPPDSCPRETPQTEVLAEGITSGVVHV